MESIQKEQSSLEFQLPTRPRANPNFNPEKIILSSNHFTLNIKNPKILIKVYSVEIDPPIAEDWRSGMEEVIEAASGQIRRYLKTEFCFAGKNIFSMGGKSDDQKAFAVKVNGQEFTVFIKKTRDTSLSFEVFKDNLTAQPAKQFLNILVKKIMKNELKLMEWGKNSKYYDVSNVVNIKQHNISIYKGFKTSCEVYSNFTPKLLIDFSSRILRNDSALSYIKKLASREQTEDEMIGRSVVASYGNCRMYRISGIDFTKNPQSSFRDFKGNDVTYEEYYRNEYKIKITDQKQPLFESLLNRGKRKIYLVPELVHMTGLSDEMRKDNQVMKDVAAHTRLDPNTRMEKNLRLNASVSKPLEREGIVLENKSEVTGYHLKFPELLFGDDKPFTLEKANFQLNWSVKKPGKFENWLFVYHEENFDEADALLNNFKKASSTLGIKVNDPEWLEITQKRSEFWIEKISAHLTKNKDSTDIVLVLIPKYLRSTLYKLVKKTCNKEFGVLSQVVIDSSLRKNLYSVSSKILQQMNVKLGYPLWWTSMPKNWGCRKAMIIGVDVFHSTGSGKNSCVGFCASLDKNLTKFFSKIKMQPGVGKELINTLGSLVQQALLEFNNHNKFLPEMIIMYRDGVGESQLRDVINVETQKIKEMFSKIKEDYKPQFAEIVVTKRINDRFFVNSGKNGYINPRSGTVVARDVVSNNFDFFLIAQDVTMGTCTPTHYNVICNDTDMTEDIFYELTYYQCFNYFNWSGPIRVPAALMYAHKIAFVTGQTYQSDHQARLNNKLFFL